MQSKAPDVPTYIDEAPEARRSALQALRELCLRRLPGHVEAITYGMPTYSKDGKPEVAFASQKKDIALYVMNTAAVAAHRDELAASAASIGKSCIRFTRPEKVDLALIDRLIGAAVESA